MDVGRLDWFMQAKSSQAVFSRFLGTTSCLREDMTCEA